MTFESIGADLAGIVASWAGDPEVRARIVTRAWRAVVGEQVARRTEALGFDDGVLRVAVLDPAWEATLRQMSGALLGRMNQALGGKLLRRIEWAPGAEVPGGRPPPDESDDAP